MGSVEMEQTSFYILAKICETLPKLRYMAKSLLFFVFALLVSCGQTADPQRRLDVTQVVDLMAQLPDLQIVDIRTPAEWQQTGHLPGAVNINYNASDFMEKMAALDPQKPVLIYCASGGRSGDALPSLMQAGFKNVYEYKGGMNDWLAKGKEAVR
jgi:thioredoxin 1